MPECRKNLVQESVFNATLAHISAASPGGPRYDEGMDDEARRHFDNLMFMCPDHGSLVDKKKLGEKYTSGWLRQAKSDHEQQNNSTASYQVPAEVLADALEEIDVHFEQTNTINGNGNTQTNNQIYIAGSNIAGAAAEIIHAAQPSVNSVVDEDPEDDEVNPIDDGSTKPPTSPPPTTNGGALTDPADVPGMIDSVALLETAVPEWTQTISDLTIEMNLVGEITTSSANILQAQNRRGQPMSAKIPVFKRLAKSLDTPTKGIENLSLLYMQQLNEINPGVHALIELSKNNAMTDLEHIEAAHTLFNSIDEMASSSKGALTVLEEMCTNLRPIEAMSNDLRKPLKRIRDGLTFMVESRPIIDEWTNLVKKSREAISSIS